MVDLTTPHLVRAALVEGSVPPHGSRVRMGGPVCEGSPETEWDQKGVLKPLSGDPMDRLSAELVVDTHIKVGNPGLFVPVKILIDSGSRVSILFRRNLSKI